METKTDDVERSRAEVWVVLGGDFGMASITHARFALAHLVAVASEAASLRAQVVEANRKRDWMAEEHARMRQERNAALAATALVKADREGVWFWEKDGENGLESLTCPVVMEAETLRDLLSKSR